MSTKLRALVFATAIAIAGVLLTPWLPSTKAESASPDFVASFADGQSRAVSLASGPPKQVKPPPKKSRPANKRAAGKSKKKSFSSSRKNSSYKAGQKNKKVKAKAKAKKSDARRSAKVRAKNKAKGQFNRAAQNRKINYTQDALKFRSVPKFAKDKLPGHYNNHALGVRAANQKAYQQKAMKFMTGKPPRGVLQARARNGDIIRYNPKNKHYGVITKDGRLKTFYKWSRNGERTVNGKWRKPNHSFGSGTEYFKHKASL